MIRILVGDVLDKLSELPDESVQCVVTSPPYWGLRDYGVDGQLGLEPTPEEWVANMVAVFREVRRVLRGDGVVWLNVGDSYAARGHTGGMDSLSKPHQATGERGWRSAPPGYKAKDLVGAPWRLAFALQADGWWLRADCIWSKPNPMPESVTDRPTKAHEYVFLLSKAARYFYDADAVREEHADPVRGADGVLVGWDSDERVEGGNRVGTGRGIDRGGNKRAYNPLGRNLRTVWTIATHPYPEAHFATFPPKLVEPCIKAGTSERGCCPECAAAWERVAETSGEWRAQHDRPPAKHDGSIYRVNPGGGIAGQNTTREREQLGFRPTCTCPPAEPVPCTVLDPFLGSGTTALVADRLGRDCIGIELNAKYAALAQKRISEDAPMFAQVVFE